MPQHFVGYVTTTLLFVLDCGSLAGYAHLVSVASAIALVRSVFGSPTAAGKKFAIKQTVTAARFWAALVFTNTKMSFSMCVGTGITRT